LSGQIVPCLFALHVPSEMAPAAGDTEPSRLAGDHSPGLRRPVVVAERRAVVGPPPSRQIGWRHGLSGNHDGFGLDLSGDRLDSYSCPPAWSRPDKSVLARP
jgi:hypothetical protein